MRRLLAAWLPVGLLAVSPTAFAQGAFDGHVKVGVLNDQSSLYADATGQGSVIAAQMALEDYMKANPNSKLKVEIIFADHQNKPDIGANLARMTINLIFNAVADHMPDLKPISKPERLRSGWLNGIKHWQVDYSGKSVVAS